MAPAVLCILLGAPAAVQVSHPLDPMTWQEHWNLLEVLRETGYFNDSTAVPVVDAPWRGFRTFKILADTLASLGMAILHHDYRRVGEHETATARSGVFAFPPGPRQRRSRRRRGAPRP